VGQPVTAPNNEGVKREGGVQTRPGPVRLGGIGWSVIDCGKGTLGEPLRPQHLEPDLDRLSGEGGQDVADEGPQAQVKPFGVEVAGGANYEPALVEAKTDSVS